MGWAGRWAARGVSTLAHMRPRVPAADGGHVRRRWTAVVSVRALCRHGAVIRGDVAGVDIGGFTVIGERAVVHTTSRHGKPGLHAGVKIGDYVSIGARPLSRIPLAAAATATRLLLVFTCCRSHCSFMPSASATTYAGAHGCTAARAAAAATTATTAPPGRCSAAATATACCSCSSLGRDPLCRCSHALRAWSRMLSAVAAVPFVEPS
jgi:hypothetical protein